MLSHTSKYAIRAAIYLALYASEQKKSCLKDISSALGIPAPFLAKVLQGLAKNGLLKSVKGPNGGFCLNKEPGDIRVMDIVEIIDGTEAFDHCVISNEPCNHEAPCSIHGKLQGVRKEMRQRLEKERISDLASSYKNGGSAVRI